MVGLLFAVLGLGILGLGIYQKRRVQAMAAWPQVTGAICSTAIEKSVTTSSSDGYDRTFTPKVEYEYVVGNTNYLGRRIALNASGYNTHGKAEAQLAAYPVGCPVVVYYNPDKPADSVLVRRAPGSLLLLLLGAGMFAIAIYGLTHGWSPR